VQLQVNASGTNSLLKLSGSSSGSGINDGLDVGINTLDAILWNREAGSIQFATSNTERARIDSSGNLGLGVVPSAWGATYRAMEVRTGALYDPVAGTSFGVTFNAYNNGTNWIYKGTGGNATAMRYDMEFGQHRWFTAPVGTAGNTISFTQALTLTEAANLLLGGTSDPGGSGVLYIANRGSVPGTPSSGGVIYVEGGALKYKGSSGTVTTLGVA
jgi:hypothetical protein